MDDRTNEGAAPAQDVINTNTASGRRLARVIAAQSRRIKNATPSSDSSGSTTTSPASVGTTPISKPSGLPSSGSTEHWPVPKNARQFAAQANRVATLILNNEIELEVARTYSAVARTAAQMLTAEVQRARYRQLEPNLSLEWEE